MISKFKGISPDISEGAYVAECAQVIGDVHIGKDASVWHNCVVRGDIRPIFIGEGSNVQEGSLLHCGLGHDLVIGRGVTVGHGAILHSCEIGDGSLIGMGSIILDGSKIGRHCLIGAGALITPGAVIPDFSLALGSPAKVKRTLTEQEIEAMRLNAEEYVMLKAEYESIR